MVVVVAVEEESRQETKIPTPHTPSPPCIDLSYEFSLSLPPIPFMLSELPPPPPEVKSIATCSDGISALSYLPPTTSNSSSSDGGGNGGDTVAATSWDGTLRVYNTQTGTMLLTQTMESGPLLSMAVVVSTVPPLGTSSSSSSSSYLIVTGGLDGSGTYVVVLFSEDPFLYAWDCGLTPFHDAI